MVQHHGLQAECRRDPLAPPAVVCIVDCKWEWIWDTCREMSAVASCQLRHLRRLIVAYVDDPRAVVDVWAAAVTQVYRFEHPQPCSSYSLSRTFGWGKVESVEELLDASGATLRDADARHAKESGLLLLKVPPEVAVLVANGIWKELICPAPYSNTFFAVPLSLKRSVLFKGAFNIPEMAQTLHPRGEVRLDPDRAVNISDMPALSNMLKGIARGESNVHECAAWIARLESCVLRDLDRALSPRRCSKEMIRYVLLAHKLRSSDTLLAVIKESVAIMISQAAADELETLRMSGKCKPPDKSAISRAQLPMDATFMLLHRIRNWDDLINGHPRAYYVAWDSSPQYGRDVLGIILRSVYVHMITKLFVMMQKLKRLWEAPALGAELDLDQFTAEKCEQELVLMERIGLGVFEHRPPLCNLGFGASSFAQKLRTYCHSLRLEHFTSAGLQEVISSTVSSMQDYGTEGYVMRVRPQSYREVLPYFRKTPPNQIDTLLRCVGPRANLLRTKYQHLCALCQSDEDAPEAVVADDAAPMDDVDDGFFESAPDGGGGRDQPDQAEGEFEFFEDPGVGAESEEDDDVELSFDHLLDIPPLHHCNDNAVKGLSDVMQDWSQRIEQGKAVATMIRRNKSKLEERVLNQPGADVVRQRVLAFKAKVYEGRWGSLFFASVQFRGLSVADFRSFWCVRRFQGHGALKPKDAARLVFCDDAVNDDGFWGFWCMLQFIFKPLLEGEEWIDSCDCHWALKHKDLATTLPNGRLQVWKKCPCRRMRAAAIVSGEFTGVIQSSISTASVEVLTALPRGLSPVELRRLLEQFNRGVLHIAFYWTMKLTHLGEVHNWRGR